MKVLWLSVNPGLYGVSGGNASAYNGGGWVSSLQTQFAGDRDLEIAIAFTTGQQLPQKKEANFTYYPIICHQNILQKIREYYGGYKHPDVEAFVADLNDVVGDFCPGIIHVFGIENPLANYLGKTDIPQIVHLQGILSQVANAFWPEGFNELTFLRKPSIREWLFRNGFVYAYKSMCARAARERMLLGRAEYIMGRTLWDKNVAGQQAPKAKYYHVDEVLRPVFYKHQGEWTSQSRDVFRIVSVISGTMYKGLDFILKTAKSLAEASFVFEWNVVGVSPSDRLVKAFEEVLGIRSDKVNVRYCGVMSAEQICDLELQSSAYVHPSYIDNSPNSLCEAQLLGMPVVATYVGGIPSLLENCEPFQLVPANGVCELTSGILKVAEDPALATSIGRAGYEVARKRHDKAAIKKDLISVYNSVINDKRGKNV